MISETLPLPVSNTPKTSPMATHKPANVKPQINTQKHMVTSVSVSALYWVSSNTLVSATISVKFSAIVISSPNAALKSTSATSHPAAYSRQHACAHWYLLWSPNSALYPSNFCTIACRIAALSTSLSCNWACMYAIADTRAGDPHVVTSISRARSRLVSVFCAHGSSNVRERSA